MSHKPVAAGKSSFDLIDCNKLFALLDIQPGATVLDLACGIGNYCKALAERISSIGKIYAVDLWQEGLIHLEGEAERYGLKQIQTLLADIREPLPLAESSIDACLLATILHDLSPVEQVMVIEQAASLLKPGGTLNIVEFKKIGHGPGPGIDIRLAPYQIEALVTPRGFTLAASTELGEFVYFEQYTRD